MSQRVPGFALVVASVVACAGDDSLGTSDSVFLTGPARTAADVGLRLDLPFDLTQPHVVSQTYCPNDMAPDGGACFSHHIHAGLLYESHGLADDRYAIDFAAGFGRRVLAAHDGVVYIMEWGTGDPINRGWGNHVHVRHPNGCFSHYAHLSERAVAHGDVVSRGALLGFEGNTGGGMNTGAHIHFAVHCPTVGDSSTFDPIIPEPLGGYTDFAKIDFDLAQRDHWVSIGGDGATHFPVGTLVKQLDQPEIYLVCSETEVCHVRDWNAFVGRRLWHDAARPMDRVVETSFDVLGCYARGPDIASPQTTRLVACGTELYIAFRNGTTSMRRRIPIAQSHAGYRALVASWGFQMNELRAGTSDECSTMPLGPPLRLRVGTIVEEASDNDFWVVTADTVSGNDAMSPPPQRYQRLPREQLVGNRYPQVAYETYRGLRQVLQIPDGSIATLAGDQPFTAAPFDYQRSRLCHAQGGQGGAPAPMSIVCRLSATQLSIDITGPVQDGVFSPLTAPGTLLEYGSDTDGWGPYTSGKPKLEWTGDWSAPQVPRTYTMSLAPSVQNLNFFLYDPASTATSWFDLDDWSISGDCTRVGGGLVHGPPPVQGGTISCSIDATGMRVQIDGPVQGLLVDGTVTAPTRILYGSDTDGWTVPYTTGKVSVPWNGSSSHSLLLPANVNNFNLFLTDGVGGRWFDLIDADQDGDSWSVGGICSNNGGVIARAPPPNGTIQCQETASLLTITVNGNVANGIFGAVPAGAPVYLEYGSDTDGWAPYLTGKPRATWSASSTSYTFVLSSSVQNLNFFLYEPASSSVAWFDLDRWDVVGDCTRVGGGIRH